MKLTKSRLKQIIKEEIEHVLKELGAGYGGTNPEFTAAVAREPATADKCADLRAQLDDSPTASDAEWMKTKRELKRLGCEDRGPEWGAGRPKKSSIPYSERDFIMGHTGGYRAAEE